MKRYPSCLAQNLLQECIFSTSKTALKFNKKVKKKNCQYLRNGWKYGKILNISAFGATFR